MTEKSDFVCKCEIVKVSDRGGVEEQFAASRLFEIKTECGGRDVKRTERHSFLSKRR